MIGEYLNHTNIWKVKDLFFIPSELELPPAQPPATQITASNLSDPKTDSSSLKMSASLKINS